MAIMQTGFFASAMGGESKYVTGRDSKIETPRVAIKGISLFSTSHTLLAGVLCSLLSPSLAS